MSERTLRERLIGGWTLLSFTGKTPSGRTFFPMGAGVSGRLVYSANGQVSVNLMEADRPRADPTTRMALLDDAAAAPLARTYLAYAGPFSVDESSGIVTHNFELCLDPARVGTLQDRHVVFHGDDELELSVPSYQGERFEASLSLLWRRC
jgi:Lipocalin-like domain